MKASLSAGKANDMNDPSYKESGKIVFLWFLSFFVAIIFVNTGFIYAAIHSNTGLVTENAYEKGLAYNQNLEAAKSQPRLKDEMLYQDGILRWTLTDAAGKPVDRGAATVFFMRPVKDGSDFSLPLKEKSPGVYEAKVGFPVHGLWNAKLDLKWNKTQFQTAQDFIVR